MEKNLSCPLDSVVSNNYNVVNNKGGEPVADKSRAEYFRELRKTKKQLVFLVEKDKAEALDRKLRAHGESRIDWFRRKLDEEIGKK